MPFPKNNKLGFVSDNPLGTKALQIKLKPGLRERIMAIPGWRDKLRRELEIWVAEWESQN